MSALTIQRIHLCPVPIFVILFTIPMTRTSPHAVKKLTWQDISQTGETAEHTLVGPAPKPAFGTPPTRGPGCATIAARCLLSLYDFYVCPKDGRSRALAARCGGYEEFFCKAWSCETTGAAYWKPSSSWDLITVSRGYVKRGQCHATQKELQPQYGKSLPLNISFTPKGKDFIGWPAGRTWGLRWYLDGWDLGVTFKIQLKIENTHAIPIGPSRGLPEFSGRIPVPAKGAITPGPTPSSTSNPPVRSTSPVITQYTGNRLFRLVQGAYTALNATSLDKTLNCWLCLTFSPPYYEGIAFRSAASNFTSLSKYCFYADHTGIVRESMGKLRERLAQRKREFENQHGWFESWLLGSPWLSTLLPTILAPLIVFLLLITFGPWAFQRLTWFIKNQIDSALPRHVSIHYHRIDSEEASQEPHQGLRFSVLRP
uniref:Endogenous retrovirus group FC1 Env polyprotein n=1 Tax=Peromyscus maniculatus bairdii TaxID=230844 RepID=A0A8C8U4B4_PERMB